MLLQLARFSFFGGVGGVKPHKWEMFCALLQLLSISAQAGRHCAFVEVQRLKIFLCERARARVRACARVCVCLQHH